MYILDYRDSAMPYHRKIEGVVMDSEGARVNITSKINRNIMQPADGFQSSIPLDQSILVGNQFLAAANWLVSEEGPYSGCLLVDEANYPIESLRAGTLARIKAKRDEEEESGIILTDGRVLETDFKSVAKLHGAAFDAFMAITSDEPWSEPWTLKDQTEIDLTPQEAIRLSRLVKAKNSKCQANKVRLDKLAKEATTLASLEDLDISSGWSI